MTAVHTKAPILAWILTALSCLLAGLAFVAVRPATVATGSPATAATRATVLGFTQRQMNHRPSPPATWGRPPPSFPPEYAESDPTGALVPGRAALEGALRTLHALAPDLRLDTANLVGDGDRVVAVVATRGTEQVTALGLPLIVPIVWGPVDVLRVTDGRIAERVGAMEPDMALERRVTAPLALPLPSARIVTLRRLSCRTRSERRRAGGRWAARAHRRGGHTDGDGYGDHARRSRRRPWRPGTG